jgi:tRNA nucleotidyltransferase (CCA-adding enzyme)
LGELQAKTILKLLQRLDAFRQPAQFNDYLLVCEADYRGRQGWLSRAYPQAVELKRLFDAARQVDRQALQGLQGKAVGQALDRMRLKALQSQLINQPAVG